MCVHSMCTSSLCAWKKDIGFPSSNMRPIQSHPIQNHRKHQVPLGAAWQLYQKVIRSVAHHYEVFQSHECRCQLHPQSGAHMWDTSMLPPPHYSPQWPKSTSEIIPHNPHHHHRIYRSYTTWASGRGNTFSQTAPFWPCISHSHLQHPSQSP